MCKNYTLSAVYIFLWLFYPTAIEGKIQYSNIRFKQLSITEGLPHNTVNAISQDNKGFMWFGTRNGLCRYDGYNITKFVHEKDDSSTLSHDFVSRLYNDFYRNTLWVSTEQGICKYNPKNEQFVRYNIKGNNKNNVLFLNTSNNKLLAGCSNGIYQYDEKNDHFIPFILCDNNGEHIRGLVEDINGVLWISSAKGLKCYNIKKEMFETLPSMIKPFFTTCMTLVLLPNNRLLFNTDQEVFVYDINTNSLYALTSHKEIRQFRCATADCLNNIWVGSENGIFVYDRTFRLIANYQQSESDLSNLNDSPIYTLFKDCNHNMWVGSYFGGVNYFIYNSDQFRIYPYGNSPNHLSGKAVRQIINAPDNSLYIATEDGGLNHLNSNREVTRSERIHKQMRIKSRNIHSLLIDSTQNLWIGLFLRGMKYYMREEHKTLSFNSGAGKSSSGFCILEDPAGKVWYGGPTGLFTLTRQHGGFQLKKISSLPVFCILNLNDSIIWTGNRINGIYQIDKRTEKETPLPQFSSNKLYITYLYKDTKENIWVGTNNDGLFVLNKYGEPLKSYSKKELGSNAIKGIIEDNQYNMWVGTDNGLCAIPLENGLINRYTIADGLPTNQFNYSSVCKKPDGELFFGTINGMISFYPDQVRPVAPRFNIVLTEIWSNNNFLSPGNPDASLPASIAESDAIMLTHKQAQSVRIEYSGLNYQYKDKTQYAMKMEGVDKDWQFVGNQHQVRFSNLPAGDYTLRIKASSDGINWDEKGQKALMIKVLPPWWLSPWAYLVYAIFILCVVYLAYRYTKARLILLMRLKTEHEQRVNMEKLNQSKINFFTYVSHDLKTPLTLILLPLQQLIKQEQTGNNCREKLEVIYHNANRMQYLIDELLTFSKIEMQQMEINVRKGNVMHFLDELSYIFEIVSKDKEIDFIVSLEETDEEVWFSPSKLERIMYNLLSNAFKYTQPGDYVKLSAKLIKKEPETFIEISVKDSGRGIPKEAQDKIFDSYFQVEKKDHRKGFGLGLALTKSLIQMHKGYIKVDSEVGKGSDFVVTLNVSESAYSASEKSLENITSEEIRKHNLHLKETIELIPEQLIAAKQDATMAKESILIVEDHKEINDYLAEIFRKDYQVLQAYNGAEACKLLKKQLPDLIICDVMMPVMDGLELTEHIKQDLNTSHIPVILLTAKTDELDHTQGYLKGADAYITKPFNAHNLELLVQNIRTNRKRNIEYFKQIEKLNITQIVNTPRDAVFMKKLVDLIMANIKDEEFGVSEIINHMKVSRSLLHTKLKSLTGCSITQFMRTIRMKEAKIHLQEGMNVSEASYAVGVSDPNYFTKCFKKEFNITPTEFLKQLK
jgi:signal transduction histidine kinase/ligand-binding sensor domain-containing protein/DNA-binding response OmpR family regulator